MIEMSNKRPPIAINKGKRKSLAALLFLLVSNDKCSRYLSDIFNFGYSKLNSFFHTS